MDEKVRSIEQNAYLHGVVLPIVLDGLRGVGYDEVKDVYDAKDFVKDLFLKRRVFDKKMGKVRVGVLKTSRLPTSQFIQFIADIQKMASEYLGVYVPDPNEDSVFYNEFKRQLR